MFVLTIYGYYLKLAVRNWNIIVEALILMVMTMMVRIVKLRRRRRRMRAKRVQLFWDWWWRWWQGRGWLRLVSGRLVAGRDQGGKNGVFGTQEWVNLGSENFQFNLVPKSCDFHSFSLSEWPMHWQDKIQFTFSLINVFLKQIFVNIELNFQV